MKVSESIRLKTRKLRITKYFLAKYLTAWQGEKNGFYFTILSQIRAIDEALSMIKKGDFRWNWFDTTQQSFLMEITSRTCRSIQYGCHSYTFPKKIV